MICRKSDRKMFEPEYQNIDCPKCLLGRIYFDREIGYYCMLCGHEFKAVEIKMLVEEKTLTAYPSQKSERGRRKPVTEIRELPARKAKAKHVSRDVIKRKRHEQ